MSKSLRKQSKQQNRKLLRALPSITQKLLDKWEQERMDQDMRWRNNEVIAPIVRPKTGIFIGYSKWE